MSEKTQNGMRQEIRLTYKGGLTIYIPESIQLPQSVIDQIVNTKTKDNGHNLENEGASWINLGYGGNSRAHFILHIHKPSRTAFPFGIVKSTSNFIKYLEGEMTIEACGKQPPFEDSDFIRPKREKVPNMKALLLAHILTDISTNDNKKKALTATGDLPFRFWCSRYKRDTFSNGRYLIEGFEDGRNAIYIAALTIARELLKQNKLDFKNIMEIVKANTVGDLYDGVWDMPEDWNKDKPTLVEEEQETVSEES